MNNVVLIGRLTRDPEVRYAPENQMAIARFTVAVDRSTSKERKADFISTVAFGKTAEFVEKYFSKGKLIGIQGRIQTGSYTNKDGATVYTTDVVAERVEFVGSKSESEGSSFKPANAGGGYGAPAAKPEAAVPEGFQALEDEDIPF